LRPMVAKCQSALPVNAATLRQAREEDYPAIGAALQGWWAQPGLGGVGARERALLVPRLWLQHFAGTSLVAEVEGRFVGFLIGFLSPDRPEEGYIHFVGVAPDARRAGIGRSLYERFFEICRRACRIRVRCVTSPQNTLSIAFHGAMGFEVEPGTLPAGAVFAKTDYDGPGVHRVAFVCLLRPAGPERTFTIHRHPRGEPMGQDVCRLLSEVFVGEGFTGLEQVGDALDPSALSTRGTAWVARAEAARLVGVVFLVEPDGPFRQIAVTGESEVHLMAVARSHRRLGIADALLRECIGEARVQGALRVILSTQPTMWGAHVLYEKHGFVRNARRDWAQPDGRTYWAYELTLQ
jgi:ribosomal protein S18 acetylase RimI-like enzyme